MATWKSLAYAEDVIANSLADANSVLYAVSDNTPAALAMGASTILARLAAGNIVAATPAEIRTLLSVEENADVTDATNVAAAGAVMESDYTAKGDLIIGSGAGTAVVFSVGANGKMLFADSTQVSGVKWDTAPAGGLGDFLADGSVPMTGDLDFAGHKAKDMALQNVADATARAALTAVLGKICFQVDTTTAYICTAV
jgi:hypothetical protein